MWTKHFNALINVRCYLDTCEQNTMLFFAVNLYNIYLFIQVSVNGVDLYEYKHRLRNLKSIGWLIIQGDVVLSTVMVQ